MNELYKSFKIDRLKKSIEKELLNGSTKLLGATFEKSRAAQIGETRNWNGKMYRKEADGEWHPMEVPKKESEKDSKKENPIVSKIKKEGFRELTNNERKEFNVPKNAWIKEDKNYVSVLSIKKDSIDVESFDKDGRNTIRKYKDVASALQKFKKD